MIVIHMLSQSIPKANTLMPTTRIVHGRTTSEGIQTCTHSRLRTRTWRRRSKPTHPQTYSRSVIRSSTHAPAQAHAYTHHQKAHTLGERATLSMKGTDTHIVSTHANLNNRRTQAHT